MSRQQELPMDMGYHIDYCYAMADRFLAGSDAWHYWMNEAKSAEEKARKE